MDKRVYDLLDRPGEPSFDLDLACMVAEAETRLQEFIHRRAVFHAQQMAHQWFMQAYMRQAFGSAFGEFLWRHLGIPWSASAEVQMEPEPKYQRWICPRKDKAE